MFSLSAYPIVSQYNTFVSSQLVDTKANKFMSRFFGQDTQKTEAFFRNLGAMMKSDYSFVVETCPMTMKYKLGETLGKFMCDTFSNLRVIHVVNIATNTGGFFQHSHIDTYLICSTTNFTKNPYVEFSTYDMKSQSYSQLNRINFTDMVQYKYSFNFSDYQFERPQKRKMSQQNEYKACDKKQKQTFAINEVA